MKSHFSSCTIGFGQRDLCWKRPSLKSGEASQTLQLTFCNPAAPLYFGPMWTLQQIYNPSLSIILITWKILLKLSHPQGVLSEHLSLHWKVCVVCLQTSLHSTTTSASDCPESLVPGWLIFINTLTTQIAWAEQAMPGESPGVFEIPRLWITQLSGWLFSQSISYSSVQYLKADTKAFISSVQTNRVPETARDFMA